MDESTPGSPPPGISGYAGTHCTTCGYGWTRRGRAADGTEVTVTWCLLDRQQVWDDMTFCDRYEPRGQPEG
jgi:hypothetical protein